MGEGDGGVAVRRIRKRCNVTRLRFLRAWDRRRKSVAQDARACMLSLDMAMAALDF